MSDIEEYIRCRNCGKQILKEETFGNWYCSKACALRFTQCPICGRFFESGKGSGEYCSPDCARTSPDDTRYSQESDTFKIEEQQ